MLLLAQLGQTPSLAAREIKSVAARDVAPSLAITSVSQTGVLLHTDGAPSAWGQLPAERSASIAALGLSNFMLALGGTLRLVDLLADGRVPRVWPARAEGLADAIWDAGRLAEGEGKLPIGLSVLGAPVGLLNPILGFLKQRAKQAGRSLRVIVPPRGSSELTAASLRQNKLLTKGCEFVLVARADGIALGLTVAAHDPNRDALLDRGIPRADARSGMLPPKLARMMVNCAVGDLKGITVLDPFCGNGRILLEASLLGYPGIGRDIETSKVEATRANLDWLAREFAVRPTVDLETADATKLTPCAAPHVVATETWLGPPLRGLLPAGRARQISEEVGRMIKLALTGILHNHPKRVVIAVPAWRLPGGGRQETPGMLDVFSANGYVGECIARYARSDSFLERVIFSADPK